MELTINIEQTDYEYLTQVEAQSGKSIQDLFLMWLSQLPLVEADYDVT